MKSELLRRLEFNDVADLEAAHLTLAARPAEGYMIGASVIPGRQAQDAAVRTLYDQGCSIWRYFRILHIPDRYRDTPGSMFQHVGDLASDWDLWLKRKDGTIVEYPKAWFGGGPIVNHCKLTPQACDSLLDWTARYQPWESLDLDVMFLKYRSWMSERDVPTDELADYSDDEWRAGAMRFIERAAKRFEGHVIVNGESWNMDDTDDLPPGVRVQYENADVGGLDGKLGRVSWHDTIMRWMTRPSAYKHPHHVMNLAGPPGTKQQEVIRGWTQQGGFLFPKDDQTSDYALRYRR